MMYFNGIAYNNYYHENILNNEPLAEIKKNFYKQRGLIIDEKLLPWYISVV